jgi:hypothetical protein
MNWQVSGINRDTGAEETIVVEADTEESAIRRGNRRGLMVSAAVPVQDQPAPDAPVDDWINDPAPPSEVEALDQEPVDPAEIPQSERQPMSLDYSTPSQLAPPKSRSAPGYNDITRGAAVLQSLATIVLILGLILSGLIGLVGLFSLGAGAMRSSEGAAIAAVPFFIYAVVNAIGVYVVYSVLRLLAACSLAVRDIARNSFDRNQS